MLESGIATWQDFKWSLEATAHVVQEAMAAALNDMERAWPDGEEHYAKLSINALIGLWARNQDRVYSMRTSNHSLDGNGCQCQQTCVDSKGSCHWDHIYVTELYSNTTLRPADDFVMAAEYVAVAKIKQALASVPVRYLKAIKTDCLLFQKKILA